MILVLCFFPLIQMNLVVAEADASQKLLVLLPALRPPGPGKRCADAMSLSHRPEPDIHCAFLLSRRLRQRWRIGATPTPRQMNLTPALRFPTPAGRSRTLRPAAPIQQSMVRFVTPLKNPGRSSDAASQLNSYFPSH